MTSGPDRDETTGLLRRAIVLGTTEEECTIFAEGRRAIVPYARPFPAPRVERVAPGHLVAIAAASDGTEVVIWRWFDAIVVNGAGPRISLWEPGHGSVLAAPRYDRHAYRPGSRAYLSAGLPGAEWWVAGPAVDRAEDADVDVDEVEKFFSDLGLWGGLI